MIIRKLVFGAILVLALSTTTIAFAKGNNNQRHNNSSANTMYTMMGQYGYDELAKDISDGDYAAKDDFMNNLSDEDYQKMIDRMREYGYSNMASMMERIDKDDMISMHNAMGGAAGCHR